MPKPRSKSAEAKRGSADLQYGMGVRLIQASVADAASKDEDAKLIFAGVDAVGHGRIPPDVRKAVVLDRARGDSASVVAVRYQISLARVKTIWRDFLLSSAEVRSLAEEEPETFRRRVRAKAVSAIENGLECDRDPYRQGALGVNVMKGIGEFASESHSTSTNIHLLLSSVPAEWKQRYIGSSSTNIPNTPTKEDDR